MNRLDGYALRHAFIRCAMPACGRGLLASEAPFLGASDWAHALSQVGQLQTSAQQACMTAQCVP